MIRKILAAAMIAASLGSIGVATPAAAVTIYVLTAPPPMRVETVPAPRRGYTWSPGYWNWRNERHQWVAGSWVRDRPGYKYHETKWEQHDRGWHMERGNWKRHDADHDGIPNKKDKDRDGDGVSNRNDRQPDNPRHN